MSVYMPKHDPPSVGDRLLGHPALVVSAWWTVIVAIYVALDPFLASVTFSAALGEIRPWAALLMGIVMFIGGAAALVGILNAWDNRSQAWALEKAGWVLIGVGWFAYAVLVFHGWPKSVVSWGGPLVFVVSGAVRVRALHEIEQRARASREDEIATGQHPQVKE